MPQIEQNGPNFKYIVSYKRRDDDNAREYSYTVERPEEFHYVVPERQPTYVPFDITVKAKNSVGDARQSVKTVIGWSGEDGKCPLSLQPAVFLRITMCWTCSATEHEPLNRPLNLIVLFTNFMGSILAEPTESPSGLQVDLDSINGHEAMLMWDSVDPDPEIVRGFFRGYRVRTKRVKNSFFCLEVWLAENYFIGLLS